MRTVPGALQTELNGTTSTPVRLVRITRKSGTIVRFCEAQTNITAGGATYTAGRGIRMSSIVYELNRTTSTVDFEIAVADGGLIDPDDARNGLYDFAEVVMLAGSHGTPANGVVELWRGYFGQAELTDRGMLKVQAIGLLSKARAIPVEHYEPRCRTDFGDARCKIDLAPLTISRTINSISGFNVTMSSSVPAQYRLGLIIPTSGGAVGEAFEIRSVSGSVVKTYLPTRGKLEVGNAVNLTPGCDFTLTGSQGCQFWDNVINFRAEPHVPGADALSIDYQTWGA